MEKEEEEEEEEEEGRRKEVSHFIFTFGPADREDVFILFNRRATASEFRHWMDADCKKKFYCNFSKGFNSIQFIYFIWYIIEQIFALLTISAIRDFFIYRSNRSTDVDKT